MRSSRMVGDDRARIARWSIGRCLRSHGDLGAGARRAGRASRRAPDALGETDGYVFEEIAERLLALGRDDEARPSFARAWEELRADPSLSVDEPACLQRLRALAG